MNIALIQAGLKRFAKGFIAGGLSSVVLIVGAGFQFHNLEDLRTYGTALLFGFLTGGLLAIEKMYNFPTFPNGTTIDGTPTGASYGQK
jgi:hypothetical protein